MNSNLDARLVYENSKQALAKAFPNIPNIASICKLTQSTLRLEVPLVAGNTLYQFNVLKNDPLFFNTETRLKQQDSAVIYQLGLFVAAPASSTDAAFNLETYPNAVSFGANAVPLQALYNGSNLSITVNNDILVPNWDVFKHFYKPETQQTAAIAADSPGDQLRGADDGFYPMEPNVVLIGSKSNVIKVELPVGLTAITANSRLICMLRCVIAQNSTVVS